MPTNDPQLCPDILSLKLFPVNEAEYGDSILYSTVYIGSYPFHCHAIEVTLNGDDETLEAVAPDFEHELEAVISILDNRPTTQTINGRTYVIAIVPHGE